MIKIKGLEEIGYDRIQFEKETIPALTLAMNNTIKGSKATTLFNDRTGLLRRSSKIKGIKPKGNSIVGTLINRAPYSSFIHGGTIKITPRPWLAVALAPEIPKLMENLGDATVRALIHKRIR